MNIKLLTKQHLEFLRFKGGCTGSSESTLVKMPHCWKSHVTAHIQCSPFIMLYFGSIGKARNISELCHKGAILQSHRKMTMEWSFFPHNTFIKFHGKKYGSHNMNTLYPNLCCSKMCYKETALYILQDMCYYAYKAQNEYMDLSYGGIKQYKYIFSKICVIMHRKHQMNT